MCIKENEFVVYNEDDVIQFGKNENERLVVVKKLGQGGFGVVYEVRYKEKRLAFKQEKSGCVGNMMKNEISVLKKLQCLLFSLVLF
jgi:predicted Ser/Thr protein kinase